MICSISFLIAIFFCLQAGKHGLFLNILLFGKLRDATLELHLSARFGKLDAERAARVLAGRGQQNGPRGPVLRETVNV